MKCDHCGEAANKTGTERLRQQTVRGGEVVIQYEIYVCFACKRKTRVVDYILPNDPVRVANIWL